MLLRKNRISVLSSAIVTVVGLSLTPVAHATIMVTNTGTTFSTNNGSSSLNINTPAWSTSGGNAVALFFTAENGIDLTATYGGDPLTVVSQVNNNHFAAIAYVIDPTVSNAPVNITSTYFGSGRLSYEYTLLSLDDVGSVAGTDSRTNNGGLSYTTTMDGGYVLGVAENNNFSAGNPPTVSGNPDMFLAQSNFDGNHSILHAHGDVALAGAYTDTYSNTGGGNILAAATVAFEAAPPTPEPSTAIFAALGLVGMIAFTSRRRTRA